MSILNKNKSFILNIYIHAGKIVYQYDFFSKCVVCIEIRNKGKHAGKFELWLILKARAGVDNFSSFSLSILARRSDSCGKCARSRRANKIKKSAASCRRFLLFIFFRLSFFVLGSTY